MLITTPAEYESALRDYHKVHDAMWRCLGTKEGESLVGQMSSLMAQLDTYDPDWWKQPKPA